MGQSILRNIDADKTGFVFLSHQDPTLANSNLQGVQFMRRFGLIDERLAILLTHGINVPRPIRSTRRLETTDSNPLG